MAKELKIGLVGCAGMASFYRERYKQIKGARLEIIIDTDQNIVDAVAKELTVKGSIHFSDVLAPDIDIVDISTPNFLHKEQAIAALKAGKHVILQKPISNSYEDAKEIVEAATQSKKITGMYMSMLDHPVYHDVKKIVDTGLLGTISSVYCRGAHTGGLAAQKNSWRSSAEKTGGGAFIQLAIHPINMAQYILNSKIIRVSAFSNNCMCPNIGGDDMTTAVCEFENNVQGTIEASYCAPANILTLYGTKGYISVLNDCTVTMVANGEFYGELIVYKTPNELFYGNTKTLYQLFKEENPYDQHIAFVEAVKKGEKAPVPLELGLYDLKIVKAVYESAKLKKFIDLDEI